MEMSAYSNLPYVALSTKVFSRYSVFLSAEEIGRVTTALFQYMKGCAPEELTEREQVMFNDLKEYALGRANSLEKRKQNLKNNGPSQSPDLNDIKQQMHSFLTGGEEDPFKEYKE